MLAVGLLPLCSASLRVALMVFSLVKANGGPGEAMRRDFIQVRSSCFGVGRRGITTRARSAAFRSLVWPAPGVAGAPHLWQKREPGERGVEQRAQAAPASGAPHAAQKRQPSAFAGAGIWHLGQMIWLSAVEVTRGN